MIKALFNKVIYILSFLFILTEALLQSFWMVLSALILYVAFILLKPDHLLLHQSVFVLLCLSVLYLLVKGYKRFHFPEKWEVENRIEQRNFLKRGSLSSLHDTQATGNKDLWERFKASLQQSVPFLMPPAIHSNTSKSDPVSLRIIPILVLVMALVIPPNVDLKTIGQNFVPTMDLPTWLQPKPPIVTAWITPPEYTKTAPIALSIDTPQPITVQQGSVINITVENADDIPTLSFDEGEMIPLTEKTVGHYALEASIPLEASNITLTDDGDKLNSWQLFMEEDKAPEVAFVVDPKETNGSSVYFSYLFRDEHDIKNIKLTVTRAESIVDDPFPEPIEITLPESYIPTKEYKNTWEGQHYEDLTSHPWAGQPALFSLMVTDAIDQTGKSEERYLILPAREFKNQGAKKIVEARLDLIQNYEQNKEMAFDKIEYVIIRPTLYQGDISVFLNLKSALTRLHLDRFDKEQHSIVDLLWDIALYLEEGLLFQAKKKLRDIQEELTKLLNDPNASQAEIDQTLTKLEDALSNFMRSTIEDMIARMERGEQPMSSFDPTSVTPKTLNDFVNQMRDLLQMGDKQSIMEMMSQLQNMFENSGGNQQLSKEQQLSLEALQRLSDIVQEQEIVMNDTDQLLTENSMSENEDKPEADDLQARQELLNQELEKLIEKLELLLPDQVPESLASAKEFMKDAATHLETGNLISALTGQQSALALLKEGMKDTLKSIEQQMNLSISSSPFPFPGMGNLMTGLPDGKNRDPFGRENGKNAYGQEVEIPDADMVQKARKVLEELRRRSSQRSRPKQELDYIERLLERF